MNREEIIKIIVDNAYMENYNETFEKNVVYTFVRDDDWVDSNNKLVIMDESVIIKQHDTYFADYDRSEYIFIDYDKKELAMRNYYVKLKWKKPLEEILPGWTFYEPSYVNGSSKELSKECQHSEDSQLAETRYIPKWIKVNDEDGDFHVIRYTSIREILPVSKYRHDGPNEIQYAVMYEMIGGDESEISVIKEEAERLYDILKLERYYE